MAGVKGKSGRKKANDIKSLKNKKMRAIFKIDPPKKENEKPAEIKSEPPPPAPPSTAPAENISFDQVASSVLQETQAAIEADKKENEKPPENKTENPQPAAVKEEPTLEPLVALGMSALGGMYVQTTGFKELDYTEEEIETCAPIITKMIDYFWPNQTGLTEEQKMFLIGGAMLLKIHNDKFKLYKKLSKEQEEAANATKPAVSSQSAA